MTQQEAIDAYPLGEVFQQINGERIALTQEEWDDFIDRIVNPPEPLIVIP